MADTLKAVYLLTGSDRPKIDRALQRLRARFPEDSIERLSAAAASGGDAVAACNALGLFGDGRRLVLVDEVERWRAADSKAIADYLRAPAPGTVLALVGEAIKRDSSLVKACAKVGSVLVYEVAKRDLPKWVAEQFARHDARATSDACRVLVELAGDDLVGLAVEVEKVATWAAGAEVGVRDVEELVLPRADVPPFELTDAWGRRDVAAVLRAAESLLERSGARARELPALVGRLAGHVRRVSACARLDTDGVRPRDAAVELKMHPFAAEKAFAQSRNFTGAELGDAVVGLADLDLALKGGSRLPPELVLERTLIALTRPSG